MALTLAQYRDLVSIGAHVEGHQDWPFVRLNLVINQALKFVQSKLNGLGYKKWEKSASLSLSASTIGAITTTRAAIPTDLLESPRAIKMLDCTGATNNGSTNREIEPERFEKVCSNTFEAPTERQAAYTRLNNYIHLFPSTITGAVIHYFAVLAELASDSATSDLPVEFEMYVVQKAINDVKAIQDPTLDISKMDAMISGAINSTFEDFLKTESEKKAAPQQANEVATQ